MVDARKEQKVRQMITVPHQPLTINHRPFLQKLLIRSCILQPLDHFLHILCAILATYECSTRCLHYDEVINTLITTLNEAVSKTSTEAYQLDKAVPVVLAGGTAQPKGFRERFEKALEESKCPVPISEVRLSSNPTQATARGAFIAAVYDS